MYSEHFFAVIYLSMRKNCVVADYVLPVLHSGTPFLKKRMRRSYNTGSIFFSCISLDQKNFCVLSQEKLKSHIYN